ncbi:UDP-3-O-acyl-N-acetylglucosamine deacetylase [Aliihoeflea sp. 40Bstr573]|uniref:UDP-3-O-acyl-N-acetylglucosamine deacetylase n=1 Tax=Aliihoeflea sp. 40Bstr573 TaxID=2696467 RepID=UPI0020948F5A|nr:UDP-3-O-acyl-N-acetylglucosamine deacetylase [Aliihoeflea sp. 40Bstr573]MCO6388073.1 UDP-3-O-acyl-N-acetylglucosamine deacetylase [Aliihoeflea sp. 40Bstr573]
MELRRQTTLARELAIEGIGVHSGKAARLELRPVEAGAGICFVSASGEGGVRVRPETVASTDLSTLIGDPKGFHVSTVEHLMSALAGSAIDNVEIAISGTEVPILDGSAIEFVTAFQKAGIVQQDRTVDAIRVIAPVRIENGAAWAEFVPHERARFEVEIEFPSPAIGRQKIAFDLEPETYAREVAPARTFGFMRDVERLWAAGLALGSSLENSVVIGEDDRVVNPGGLRFADEFVRHKALDAVGDIAVGGLAVIGCYRSFRGGHKLNAGALSALLATPEAFERL